MFDEKDREELCNIFDELMDFARDTLKNDMFLPSSITKERCAHANCPIFKNSTQKCARRTVQLICTGRALLGIKFKN